MKTAGDNTAPAHKAAFAPDADGGFFYDGADLAQRLNLLQHLSQSSDLVLLVSGQEGSGKTTLLNQFQRRAGDRWHVCRIEATDGMQPHPLMRRIARYCDLPTDCGETALYYLLTERAASLTHNGKIPVIAVDDAHLLDRGALLLLARLAQAGEDNTDPWHILLFANPDIEAVLGGGHDPVLSAAKLHTVRLAPLTAQQTADYVRRLLETAGPVDTPLFSQDKVRTLHRESHGLPGRINSLVLKELQVQASAHREPAAAPAPVERSTRPGRRVPYGRVIVGIVLALAVGTALMFQDRINALFKPGDQPVPADDTTATKNGPLSQTAPTTGRIPSGRVAEAPPSPAVPPAVERAPVPAPTEQDQETAPPPIPEPPRTAPGGARPGSITETLRGPASPPAAKPAPIPAQAEQDQETAPLPAPAHPPPPPPTAPAQVDEATPPPTRAQAARSEPAAAQAPSTEKPAPEPAAGADAVAGPGTGASPAEGGRPAAELSAPPKEAAKLTAASAESIVTSLQDKDWILDQAPAYFTLQLLGSRNADTIHRLAKTPGLGGPAAFYRTQYQGRDWYVLVLGVFKDFSDARKAVDKLPAAVRNNRPWIRKFKEVQDEIRNGKK